MSLANNVTAYTRLPRKTKTSPQTMEKILEHPVLFRRLVVLHAVDRARLHIEKENPWYADMTRFGITVADVENAVDFVAYSDEKDGLVW